MLDKITPMTMVGSGSVEMRGPVVRTIRSAPVQALGRADTRFLGGPVLGDDPDSLRLRHTRRHTPVDEFAPALVDPQPLVGSYAYLGIAFNHFGHAMSEMIHRIVPTRQLAFNPRWLIVTARGANPTFTALPSVSRTILALFGIDETNCTVLASDAIVEELLIVEAGSDLVGGPKPWYRDLMRGFVPGLLPCTTATYPARIYVSRSGLDTESGFLGERVLERLLAGAGFHILHPERLSLRDQIAHYAAAQVLIFAEGSACHGVELFGADGLAHTILLNRRNKARNPFAGVLASRSRRFDEFAGNPLLGSAHRGDGGVPLLHRGVTALALRELAAFLDTAGVARLGELPHADYLAAAQADLDRYLTSAAPPARVVPGAAAALRGALAAAVRPDGSIAPVAPPTRPDPRPQEREARRLRRRAERRAAAIR